MGSSTSVTVGCAVGIPVGVVFITVLLFWIRANKKYKKELENDDKIDGFKFDNNNDLDLDDIIDSSPNSNSIPNNTTTTTTTTTPNNQTDSDKSNSNIQNTNTTTNNINSSSSDGNNSFNYDIENNTNSNNSNNNTYIKPKRNNTFKKPSKIMGLKLQKNDVNLISPSYQNNNNNNNIILNSGNNSSIFNNTDNTNNLNTPIEYKNFYESVIPILPSSSTLTSNNNQQQQQQQQQQQLNSNNNSTSNFLQQPFSTTNSTPKSMKMDQYFNTHPQNYDSITDNNNNIINNNNRNSHLSIQQQQQQDYIKQLHKSDSSSFPITTQTLAIASPSKINLINNYPKIISPGGSFSGLPSSSNVSRSGSSLNLLNNNSSNSPAKVQQTEPTTPLKKSSDQLLQTPINLSNNSNSISNESFEDPKSIPPFKLNDKSPFDTPPRSSQIYQDDSEVLNHTDDDDINDIVDIDIDVEKNKNNYNSNRKSWLRSLTKP